MESFNSHVTILEEFFQYLCPTLLDLDSLHKIMLQKNVQTFSCISSLNMIVTNRNKYN